LTEIICYEDSYIKTFSAKVVSSNNNQIILDRTAFYPGGGGQPCDIGELKSPQATLEVSKVNQVKNVYKFSGIATRSKDVIAESVFTAMVY